MWVSINFGNVTKFLVIFGKKSKILDSIPALYKLALKIINFHVFYDADRFKFLIKPFKCVKNLLERS